ncbi:MAG: hypothetical protein EOO52_19590 [Gammaproteobacteria bacterium]|nr:MAG: hypothetical protein EOO52_19590 [Gammaproteobacteria bacterium]
MNIQFDSFEMIETFNCSIQKLFNAFTDPAIKQEWFAGGAHSTTHDTNHYSLDSRVGGKEVFQFTLNHNTPVPGLKISMESECLVRIDEQLLIFQSRMASNNQNLSATTETFQFYIDAGKAVVKLTQQGTYLEGADGPQMRKNGFAQLFTDLRTYIGG